MALILHGVSFSYGRGSEFEQPAVREVGFALDAKDGPMLIAGSTGSGKSTLLRLAAGLLTPHSGQRSIDEGDFTEPPVGKVGGVGLVFQSPETQLFAETVLADVMFGPLNQGRGAEEAEQIATESLRSVGLDPAEFGPRSPFTLSGGEARRAAIAGVIAMEPAYLLLDEPLAGLDAEGRELILGLVRRMSSSVAVAIVSHDIEEVLPVCEKVLVLDSGEVSFSGLTRELLANPEILPASGLDTPPLLAVHFAARTHGVDMDGVPLDPLAMARALVGQAGESE